uniref:Uncharacterized protein n=1 Tax=Arundo donax TaxID=35708 RepID=A0A0A9C7T9_ARUDO
MAVPEESAPNFIASTATTPLLFRVASPKFPPRPALPREIYSSILEFSAPESLNNIVLVLLGEFQAFSCLESRKSAQGCWKLEQSVRDSQKSSKGPIFWFSESLELERFLKFRVFGLSEVLWVRQD